MGKGSGRGAQCCGELCLFLDLCPQVALFILHAAWVLFNALRNGTLEQHPYFMYEGMLESLNTNFPHCGTPYAEKVFDELYGNTQVVSGQIQGAPVK